MPYDRSTTMAARRGGHRPEDASLLQAAYASDIRTDMTREGLSTNALAGRIGIKPGTLKGYLDGVPPWPIGIIKTLADLLGRSSDADLVALGYVSSPLAQRFLSQQQQLRLTDMLQRTALFTGREPLANSPGAQLAAAVLTSPEAHRSGIDLRLRPLSRGRRHPMPFAELLIADFPGQALTSCKHGSACSTFQSGHGPASPSQPSATPLTTTEQRWQWAPTSCPAGAPSTGPPAPL